MTFIKEDILEPQTERIACTMPASRTQTGTVLNDDCAAADDGNDGCGVEFAANTFGPSLNAAGGGWCVTVISPRSIALWN